ncbi:MAG: flap endonuclease-1 [wastewater metagenome]|nr:flap endonuclease-1 [Candidatus Loosdrechtia aerotolerans]
MGVNLTPIIIKKEINLQDFRGRTLVIDGNAELYQFTSSIRMPDGTLLKDSHGNITSHLVGLLYRSTRLISNLGIRLIFVFNGVPPLLKKEEIEKRRRSKEKYTKEYQEAVIEGDIKRAMRKRVMTSGLTFPMIEDAKRLLQLLGIPYVQAASEGEAQAAFIVKRKDAWAVGSMDYDSLLFGAPRLVRFITFSGRRFLPGKGGFRSFRPEIIESDELFHHHQISLKQLIDIAILIGTDFNLGIKGIGPKTALKLIKKYGSIEYLPESVRTRVSNHYQETRRIFYHPQVTEDYSLKYSALDKRGLYTFLCKERDFSRERVKMVVERMKAVTDSFIS